MKKVQEILDDDQKLTRLTFATVIHQVYPEISRVQRFSREGKILIDDALNCLFNAFDIDRSGKLSYKKFSQGLGVLCDCGPGDT
jgi:hypothetical protein